MSAVRILGLRTAQPGQSSGERGRSRRPRRRAGLLAGLLGVVALLLMGLGASSATAQPFACSSLGYLLQYPDNVPPTSVYQVDLASGATSSIGATPGMVNAVGYNTVDNYMYGWDNATNQVVRIENGLTQTPLGLPLGVDPTAGGAPNGYVIGDVDSSGHYWMASGGFGTPGLYYELDLTTTPPTVLRSGSYSLPPGLLGRGDWAWINGSLYGVAGVGGAGSPIVPGTAHLIRFDPNTGVTSDEGPLPFTVTPSATNFGTVGAVYADAAGNLWAQDNLSGNLYRINPTTKQTSLVSHGPTSGFNDGARCATAPIPTMTVVKKVEGRASSSDQFTVGVQEADGKSLTSATTQNTETTVSTIDWPVSEGKTYTITDAMAAGPSKIEEYVKSISCVDGGGNPVTATGSGPNWQLLIAKPTAYTCTVVNKAEADVEIEKSSAARLVPGKPATYTLKATNNGPTAASNVVVSDPLPAGETFVSASAGCTESGGKVSCTIASLAVGASQTFEVNVKVASAAKCASLDNTATVTSDVFDPNMGNNSSSVRDCGEKSDLEVQKAASSAKVTPNGQLMYTLVVKNNGPSDNSNVTVTDVLRSGLAPQSAKASQGSCAVAGQKVSCKLGDLVAGGSAQVLVTANVALDIDTGRPSSACGNNGAEIKNFAEVVGDGFDPNQANNRDSTSGCVPPSPPPPPHYDLVVKKKANHKRIKADGKVTYKLAVTNKGPAPASGIKVTDTFGQRGKVIAVKTTSGSCTKALPVSCSLGNMASGAKATITIVLKPLEAGCRQRNAASVTGEGTDTNPANNLSTADICVAPRLALVKTVDRKSVEAGGIVHYTIRVTNLSKKIAAQDVRTCDRMPAGLAYVGSQPKAKISNGMPCWTKAVLKGAKSVVYHVTAKALRSASGTLHNVATTKAAGSKGKALRDDASVVVPAKAPKPTPVTG